MKGATPAHLILVAYFILYLIRSNVFIFTLLIYLTFYVIAQTFLLFLDVPINTELPFFSGDDYVSPFRISHLTQSIYLIPCFSLFIFTLNKYDQSWDKYIVWGIKLLLMYGVFEFLYFLVFNQNGDFLSNRSFGDGDSSSGSAFQIHEVAGYQLLRVCSLTGEPSMFAFSIIGVYFYYHRDKSLYFFILLMLILSNSVSAYIGLLVGYIFINIIRLPNLSIRTLLLVFALIIFVSINAGNPILIDLYEQVSRKLAAQTFSGSERLAHFIASWDYWMDLPFLSKFFGIGWGTLRPTNMFSFLIVNVGLFGLFFYCSLFLYPLLKLKGSNTLYLRAGLFSSFIISLVSVPEFSYLPQWFLLGVSYNVMQKQSIFSY